MRPAHSPANDTAGQPSGTTGRIKAASRAGELDRELQRRELASLTLEELQTELNTLQAWLAAHESENA